ncbi:hypothetical protein PIB30_065558, partial [Stylosanthes scabra]|nr:hypothetical protein [Stylosanthes scabra]
KLGCYTSRSKKRGIVSRILAEDGGNLDQQQRSRREQSATADPRKRNRLDKPNHLATGSSLKGTFREANPRGYDGYGSSEEGGRAGKKAASHPR